MLDNLEKLLAAGTDNAMLRYSLGTAYFKQKNYEQAIEHLRCAVQHDADYSAAWKFLGRALQAVGRTAEAVQAYESGLAAAQRKGDKQAEREMQVFYRRLQKPDPS